MGYQAKAALDELGVTNPEETFQQAWKRHVPVRQVRNEGLVTMSMQRAHERAGHAKNFKHFAYLSLVARQLRHEGAAVKGWQEHLPEEVRAHIKGLNPAVQKAIDENLVGGNTAAGLVPLVFDPEVLSILRNDMPFKVQIPVEGQQGFTAVVNRIDARDKPLGYRTEAQSADLSAEADKGWTPDRISRDMKIWVDKTSITDFARLGAQHYIDVRDTTFGERIGAYGQETEINALYGDPTGGLSDPPGGESGTGGDDGDWGDARGFIGVGPTIEAAGNSVDKSAVSLSGTDTLVKDIKAEIKEMLKSPFAINPADLRIWTSWDVHDRLENDQQIRARQDQNDNTFDFGYSGIRISGVPVTAGHNIKEHASTDSADGATVIGSPGDVFIVNMRELRYRALMPLSTVQLAKVGFSEQAAMGEFGTVILRAAGNLSRWLKDYQV